jgi:hypothetical protein
VKEEKVAFAAATLASAPARLAAAAALAACSFAPSAELCVLAAAMVWGVRRLCAAVAFVFV